MRHQKKQVVSSRKCEILREYYDDITFTDLNGNKVTQRVLVTKYSNPHDCPTLDGNEISDILKVEIDEEEDRD